MFIYLVQCMILTLYRILFVTKKLYLLLRKAGYVDTWPYLLFLSQYFRSLCSQRFAETFLELSFAHRISNKKTHRLCFNFISRCFLVEVTEWFVGYIQIVLAALWNVELHLIEFNKTELEFEQKMDITCL